MIKKSIIKKLKFQQVIIISKIQSYLFLISKAFLTSTLKRKNNPIVKKNKTMKIPALWDSKLLVIIPRRKGPKKDVNFPEKV